jgi:hypothetical protein
MDSVERSVVAPQIQIVEECTARREVLWDRTPLAPRAQYVHNPIHDFAHIHPALVAATLGWWDQWSDASPFIIRQITWVS